MPIIIEDHGRNNRLDIADALRERLHGIIRFNGSDNYVGLQAPAVAEHLSVSVGERCRVAIGPHCLLGRLAIHCEHNGRAQIGAAVGFTGPARLLLHEPGAITIGDHCLFAGDNEVSISDIHGIFDEVTGERLNPPGDIEICERVWVGVRAIILKGVTIAPDCVIGAGAVVTRNIGPNSVAAGNPARVVRHGVVWRQAERRP